MKAIHHISYHLSSTRHHVAGILRTWLKKHAYWQGGAYSTWFLAPNVAIQGITGVWDQDFSCLSLLAECADTN